MLNVNFGFKDTDKSVITCTESPKRDRSIIAIVCLLCLLQGYDGGAVPPICRTISLSQSCTKGFRNMSQPIWWSWWQTICRSCFSALPSKQQARLFWVHWNTKRYAVHTEASKLSRCKSSCCGRLKKTEQILFFLLAMTRYQGVNTVVNFFFRNYNGSARMLNIGMYHTIDMVLSEAV